LQQEIEEETGVTFTGRLKNARAKVKVQTKTLDAEEAALFEAIWQKINYQTRFSVKLDTPELVKKCTAALADTDQYPKARAPKIRSATARIVVTQDGLHGVQSGAANTDVMGYNVTVPDVYAYIQNRVHLSRATLFAILDGSGRLGELLINPQAFLDTAIAAIKNSLQALLVQGIEYHEINGQRYEMTLWDEVETYLSSVYPPAADSLTPPVSKTILQAQPLDDHKDAMGNAFSCVLTDSSVESKFAQDCSDDERVRFFFKLPSRFKIPTPLGTYNPDWAVVFEGDARVYFVAETKSSTIEKDRRHDENLKIACGRKHFALSKDVVFRDVVALEGLV
jgi:type III restriction enzyme